MAKKIKLSTDYQCWPLWWSGSDEVGNVDPRMLPLSSETIARLEQWAETFDNWMDLNNPTSDKEPSDKEIEAFEREGINLWKQLRKELAPDYEVVYYSKKHSKLLTDPDSIYNVL